MTQEPYSRLRTATGATVRNLIRRGDYQGHTAGLSAGYLQANVVILPSEYALDFMRFCQRNPKPCPLVGVSETGNPIMHTLGADIDIRTDIPAYNIYRDGLASESTIEISAFWRADHVAFALGCSFTFENALIDAGIPIWHIANDRTVPMYRSSIMTESAGVFGGEMVVTMRAVRRDQIDEVIRICRNYPLAHGAPVHVGSPQDIGIADLSQPDWGDAAPAVEEPQVPVFWACGVTPQQALMRARLPLAITHKPGHMLITDIDDQAEVPVYQPSS